jgi:hypothetical protein
VSKGILEGPVPMVRPGPRKNMADVPMILLSSTKQRSGGTSRERLHLEDRPRLRNLVPKLSESGLSTRIFHQLREREPQLTAHSRVRELTKGGLSNGGG